MARKWARICKTWQTIKGSDIEVYFIFIS